MNKHGEKVLTNIGAF